MGFRQIYIKNARVLRLKDNNLKIVKHDGEEIELPIEDINNILLEDPTTIITSRLLTKLAELSVSLTLCNEKFFPAAQVLPWNSYYNQSSILKLQFNAPNAFKDNIWKKIVKQKISNQRDVIKYTTGDEESFNLLDDYQKSVKVGDKDNREGISARCFFANLYGKTFVRFGDSPITSALNYGYSIFHGSIVRQLVSIGLNTCLGVWHDSTKNAYNLASDLIEPFRALVDYYVYWNQGRMDSPLGQDVRKELINLLNEKIIIGDKECKVEFAINVTCQSYLKALQDNDYTCLELPTVKEVDFLGRNEL